MLFFSYANLTYAIIFVDNVFGPRYSARAVRFPLAFTVTVTTSGPAHSLRLPPVSRIWLPALPVSLGTVTLLLLLLASGAFKRAHQCRARQPVAVIATICLVAAVLFASAGCGGGSPQSVVVPAPPPPRSSHLRERRTLRSLPVRPVVPACRSN